MKALLSIFIIAALSLWQFDAYAFWDVDSSSGNSGLNVSSGFDVNTIITVRGTVSAPPERKGGEQQTVMSVSANKVNITVILGPWWFWEKNSFKITKNQEIIVTGSQAQGKDGVSYLFAQKVESRSTGEIVSLRTEAGKPLWSGGGTGSRSGGAQLHDGSGSRTGAGIRGYGMRGGRR